MKTTRKTMEEGIVITDINQIDEVLKDETARVTLGIGGIVTGIIGLWAVACLIGGLINGGVTGIMKGYFSAITGY